MKTAISLPDALFKSGDTLARRLGVSRSALYARALAEYVAKHKADRLTKQLDAVYGSQDTRIDRGTLVAQSRALPRESW